MKRWIIFSVTVLASLVAMGQRHAPTTGPTGWTAFEFTANGLVESVSFASGGHSFSFSTGHNPRVMASSITFNVCLSFIPIRVELGHFHCDYMLNIHRTPQPQASTNVYEFSNSVGCWPDHRPFQISYTAYSFPDIFAGSQTHFYGNRFSAAIESRSGGGIIYGQPWSSRWENDDWVGDWGSWGPLNNFTVSRMPQLENTPILSPLSTAQSFRIFQARPNRSTGLGPALSSVQMELPPFNYLDRSIIVHLHWLPLPNTIHALAKSCGYLGYITIPFEAPLETNDRILEVRIPPTPWADEIVASNTTSATDINANNRTLRLEIPYQYREVGEGLFPLYVNWISAHMGSQSNSDSFQIRIIHATPLSLTATNSVNPTCPGDSDGSITIRFSGGRPFGEPLVANAEKKYRIQVRRGAEIIRNMYYRTISSWDVAMSFSYTISNLPAGIYTITVFDRDSSYAITVVELSPPDTPADSIFVNYYPLVHFPNGIQNDTIPGRLTVKPSSNTHSYSWNGGQSSPSNTQFLPTTAGRHILRITYNNGLCHRYDTVEIGIGTLEVPQVSVERRPFCQTSPTGILHATQTQKNTLQNSSFSWYRNDTLLSGSTENSLYGVLPGDYRFCINYRDVSSCTTIELNPQPMQITVVESSDLRCHGDFSGMVVLRVEQGSRNFMWNDNLFSDAIRIEGLPAQPQITIRDLGDPTRCYTEMIVNLTQPDPITIRKTNIQHVVCHGDFTGKILFTVSGGAGNYTWPKYTGNFTQTSDSTFIFSNLPKGNHEFTVKDGNNCSIDTSFTITQPEAPLQITNIFSQKSRCHGDYSGFAWVEVSGGTWPYTFQWNDYPKTLPREDKADTLHAIEHGMFIVVITDHNECKVRDTVILKQRDKLELTYLVTNPHHGFYEFGQLKGEFPNGIIKLEPFGGTGNRILQKNNGDPIDASWGTVIVRDLDTGAYTILLTDSLGCKVETTVYLTRLAPLRATIHQLHEILCYGYTTGILNVEIEGGIPPYTIRWIFAGDTISYTDTIKNRRAGLYLVMVTDSSGNVRALDSFRLVNPEQIAIALEQKRLTIVGIDDASITATISGGQMPYFVSWYRAGEQIFARDTLHNTQQSRIENLSAGFYSVRASDNKGCATIAHTTIVPISELQIRAEVTNRSHRGTFNGIPITQDTTPDGQIRLYISGGIEPYLVTWNLVGGNLAGSVHTHDSTVVISGLMQGTYFITVEDSVGNLMFDNFEIRQPSNLYVNIELISGISCYADSDGVIKASAHGGIAPYTFRWSTPNLDTTATLSNLSVGTYSVVVIDSIGIQSVFSFTLTQPNPLAVNVSITDVRCYGNQTGMFTLTPVGGSLPYLFSNDEQQIPRNTFTTTNLHAGVYQVSVVDRMGCTQDITIEITQPERLSVIAEIKHPICYGYADGAIALKPIGGVEPHDFLWLNHHQQNLTITDLRAGVFYLRLHDGNNCRKDTNFVLIDPPKLVIQSLAQSVVLCAGQHHQPVPQPDTLNFQWWSLELRFTSNEQSPKLHEGIYFVRAINQHLCYAKDSILITQAPDTVEAQFWLNSDVFINEVTTIVHVSYPVPDSALWVIPDNVEIVSYSFEYVQLVFHEQGEHVVGLIAYKGACVDYAETQVFANGERKEELLQNSPTLFDYAFVSPNPSRDYFELRFRTRRDADLLIQLFRANTAQQPVRTFRRNARANQTETETVPVQNLPPGTYVLTIQHNTDRQVLKLIIL